MRKHKGLMSEESISLLKRFGENIDLARVRRRLRISTVCGRAGISSQTYQRLKNGEEGVTLAVVMNVLSALDLESTFALVASPDTDEVGIAMERAAQPDRVSGNGEGSDVLAADW
ncbi:helix-turn-helix domain-containing protein [Pseudomonas sp. NPDC096950]|uniref:helix-turn-helix domain-containing protein n=1 Tax=Pseudomonas sp. NPDC096950 TaxID=3364485 RepID=UPI00383A3856